MTRVTREDRQGNLPGLAEPPTSEVRELSCGELIGLCERVKREGRYIAILEVVKDSRWRAVIRRLPAWETVAT